jgi:hypothetical protein
LTNEDSITVHVKYQQTEQTFTGDANQVWININKFFSELLPALQTVKKITLTVDLKKLIEDCQNIIAVAPEGPVLLVPKQKLTNNETLLLHLLATYVGNKLGKIKDSLAKEELQVELGKTAKITSTRLSELIRERYVTKTEVGNYKITTLGIKQLQQEVLPELREKLQRCSKL